MAWFGLEEEKSFGDRLLVPGDRQVFVLLKRGRWRDLGRPPKQENRIHWPGEKMVLGS